MASVPPPEVPPEPAQPGQPSDSPPEIAPPTPDIDIPAPQSDPTPGTPPAQPTDLGDFA
jgi:hypothetical protein